MSQSCKVKVEVGTTRARGRGTDEVGVVKRGRAERVESEGRLRLRGLVDDAEEDRPRRRVGLEADERNRRGSQPGPRSIVQRGEKLVRKMVRREEEMVRGRMMYAARCRMQQYEEKGEDLP